MRISLLTFVAFLTAALDSTVTHAGVVGSPTGDIHWITPNDPLNPIDLTEGSRRSDTEITFFAERQGVFLPIDLNVNISEAGTSPDPVTGNLNRSQKTYGAGTRVDSYFFHFESISGRAGNTVLVSGSITFDQDILGIAFYNGALSASDEALGLGSLVIYPTGVERELDIARNGVVGNAGNDSITLSSDLRTVTFNIGNTGGLDQARIITAVPEVSPALFLGVATAILFSVGCLRRRNKSLHLENVPGAPNGGSELYVPFSRPRRGFSSTLLLLGVVALFSLPSAGYASTQLFYGLDGGAGNGGAHPNSDAARSQFLAALTGLNVGTQDFESFPGNGFGLLGQSVGFSGISATGLFSSSSGTGNAVVRNATSPEFPISGANYLYTVIGPNRPFFEITFSEPVFALGFYGVGVSDYFGFPGVTSEYINLDGGSPIGILNVDPGTVPNFSVNYFGVVSTTPFTNVRFYNPGFAGDSIGIDDLTIATAVPEANSLLLVATTSLGMLTAWLFKRNGRGRVTQS